MAFVAGAASRDVPSCLVNCMLFLTTFVVFLACLLAYSAPVSISNAGRMPPLVRFFVGRD